MITAICNIFLNSDQKFEHFKQNFSAVYTISDNWLIYFRGRYAREAEKFIKKGFPDWKKNCTFFQNLNDEHWARSTNMMLHFSKYEFIYVFLEDHFLMKSVFTFRSIVSDFIKHNLDYLQYSFFNIGFSDLNVELVDPVESTRLFFFELNNGLVKRLADTNPAFYPYSLASLSSKKYFMQLLQLEDSRLVYVPYLLQVLMEKVLFSYPRNRNFWFRVNQIMSMLNWRFVIYPQKTPFNLEKSLFDFDTYLMPINVGVLKEELFANWDDDNKLSNSSLIKRGLYPNKLFVTNGIDMDAGPGRLHSIVKGKKEQFRYCPDIQRVTILPLKFIKVIKGSLRVSGMNESRVLNSSESTWVHANVLYTIEAIEKSEYITYLNYQDTK